MIETRTEMWSKRHGRKVTVVTHTDETRYIERPVHTDLVGKRVDVVCGKVEEFDPYGDRPYRHACPERLLYHGYNAKKLYRGVLRNAPLARLQDNDIIVDALLEPVELVMVDTMEPFGCEPNGDPWIFRARDMEMTVDPREIINIRPAPAREAANA